MELYHLPFGVNTHHLGLSVSMRPNLLWFENLCHLQVCCHHATKYDSKQGWGQVGVGGFCVLCESDWWWSQTSSWLRIRRSSPALNNFPHRKPARCLVTFWVLCGWHRMPLKIDLSSTLPEEACSLKMSLPFPFQTQTSLPRYSPSLLTQQLPNQKPASHQESRFPLLGKGQKCLESRRKQPFIWILAKTALLK